MFPSVSRAMAAELHMKDASIARVGPRDARSGRAEALPSDASRKGSDYNCLKLQGKGRATCGIYCIDRANHSSDFWDNCGKSVWMGS
jgi:hypothetical protein